MKTDSPVPAPDSGRQAPVRILMVEDSIDDYDLLLIHLRNAPFQCDAKRVDTGHGLREALAAEPWDIVISDHNLPSFGSGEALEIVKQSGRDIPFIIMSGTIGETAAVEAMQAGADDYLMKHNPSRLIAAIERSLRAAAERRERRQVQTAYTEALRRYNTVASNMPGIVLRLVLLPESGEIVMPYVSSGHLCEHSQHAVREAADLFAILTPFDADALRDMLYEAGRSGERLFRWEGRLGRPCCVRWLLLAATRDASYDGIAWDGLLTDVTPEKDALEKLAEARAERSALIAHQEAAKEAERAEIAREIHDDVGGLLTGLKTDVAWLKRHLPADPGITSKLNDMNELVNSMVEATRRLAKALRPAILDQGLNAALEWQTREFEERSGIECHFKSNEEEVALDAGSATGVFRVFQEALTNVVKHADASKVDVQLFSDTKAVTLEIHDNGKGFLPPELAKTESFGVRGMKERVEQLGGWIEVNGAPGKGTTIMLSIPRDRKRRKDDLK